MSISSPSSALELRLNNTLDTWYGTWQGMFSQDSGTINENLLSIRLSESNIFTGELDILHTIYWDYEFGLKDTTLTRIFWKRVEVSTPRISVVLGDFHSTFGQGLMLSMEADDHLQRDRRIEGMKIGANAGCLELTQIWGIPYEIDRLQKKYEILNDTSDILFGMDVSGIWDI
ncbi:MAG: hypothetical protein HY769_06485, partial [Candidatus Stahlbacteria bacterium]|nr:hypothetical protein [Candidatus Stahlbacteria bacterium]